METTGVIPGVRVWLWSFSWGVEDQFERLLDVLRNVQSLRMVDCLAQTAFP